MEHKNVPRSKFSTKRFRCKAAKIKLLGRHFICFKRSKTVGSSSDWKFVHTNRSIYSCWFSRQKDVPFSWISRLSPTKRLILTHNLEVVRSVDVGVLANAYTRTQTRRKRRETERIWHDETSTNTVPSQTRHLKSTWVRNGWLTKRLRIQSVEELEYTRSFKWLILSDRHHPILPSYQWAARVDWNLSFPPPSRVLFAWLDYWWER